MPETFERIANNFASPIRYDTMDGKQYLVAPMSILGEGVHHGSNGPLYYPESELSKTPVVWNHKPVVIYHPTKDGEPVSACDPAVLEAQGVGIMMNTIWDDKANKLRSEAWMDEEKLKKVDMRVYEALKASRVIEVSTGVFTDNKHTPGEWNKEKYNSIATNYRPDHLAILYDMVGAYSVADGGGMLQLNNDQLQLNYGARWPYSRIEKTPKSDFADPARELFPIDNQMDVDAACQMVAKVANSKEIKLRIEFIAKKKGLKLPDSWVVNAEKDMSINALSFSAVRSQLYDAMKIKYATIGWSGYVVDIYPNYFIYEVGSDYPAVLYMVKYSVYKDVVSIIGEPETVVKVTQYKTVQGVYVGNSSSLSKETQMSKALVDNLIAKDDRWKETDREFLMTLKEDQLKKMEPIVKEIEKKVEVPVANTEKKEEKKEEKKPTTMADFVANAPEEYRDILSEMASSHSAEKTDLISAITSNTANEYTEDELKAKKIAELRKIAKMARNAAPQTPEQEIQSFLGANGRIPQKTGTPVKIVPLTVPSVFGDEKKAS